MTNILLDIIHRMKQNFPGFLRWTEMEELLGIPVSIVGDDLSLQLSGWGTAFWKKGINLNPASFEFGEDFLNIVLAHEFTHCLTSEFTSEISDEHNSEFISLFEEISAMSYEEAERIRDGKAKELLPRTEKVRRRFLDTLPKVSPPRNP